MRSAATGVRRTETGVRRAETGVSRAETGVGNSRHSLFDKLTQCHLPFAVIYVIERGRTAYRYRYKCGSRSG